MSRPALHLIFNPQASTTNKRAADMVKSKLADHYQVIPAPTEFSGHAKELAREIALRGDSLPVVVLGGDGTANQAADGLRGSRVPMLALPGGSTSVFARSLGCPRDLKHACDWALQVLQKESIQRVDMGMVGKQSFLFAAGFGLDAETAKQVDAKPQLKAKFKGGFFAWTALGLLQQNYVRGDVQIQAEWDGGSAQGITLLLQNGPVYSYLGARPLILDTEGDYQSGLISGIMVKDLSAVSSANLAMRLLSGLEEPHQSQHVVPIGPCREIRITAQPSVECQVDGEALGAVEKQTIRCLPRALKVYCQPNP